MTGPKPIDARLATALVVVALAVLFVWQMVGVRQTALAQAGQQAMALARTAELQVVGSLRGAEMLASDIVTLLDGHGLGDLDLQPTLRTRLAAYPDLLSLQLVGPDGREVQAVARTRDGGTPNGLGIWPETVMAPRPLVAADGSRLGVAMVGVAVRPVLESLASLPLGSDGGAWLIGADGRIVVPPPAAMRTAELPPDAAATLARTRGPAIVRLTDGRGGLVRLVAVRPVTGYPLTIAVGMSVDTVLAPWRQNLIWYGSAALLLAGLALIHAWLLEHHSRGAAVARREQERLRAAAAAHQRGILDATADGLVTIDRDGLIQGLNRSAERIFGYRDAEIRGQPVARLMPALDGETLPGGHPRDLIGVRQDGSAMPLDLVVTELPPEAALAAGDGRGLLIGTVRDLSERRAAETALRSSEARNAAILSAAAEGVIAVDAVGRMETVNAAAGRIFGYDPADMIGRDLAMLIPSMAGDGPDLATIAAGAAPGGGSQGVKREVAGARRDGAAFPLEITVGVMDQADGPLFIAVVSDITQRKEAEVALRSAKLDAEAANQAKTQFLAHMSHELRTPLNAIIGFSDMMRLEMMGGLSPTYLDYARNINDSGRQLIGIIDDLLDVSRLQLGKFALADGVVDLHSAVVGALAMMRPRAEDGGVILTQGVAESLPKLCGDARAIRQVLINLVSNAVKFTPKGGNVRVSAERSDDGRLLLAVTDTGRGIPPDMIGRVLDPFHHADAFKASKTRGVGLGLPICRWLMELHGGSLTIESGCRAGTTVVAAFPKERVLH